MKKIIVIAGVTASGKSKLAVELAKRINGEIISADSVAVYHELNIGSAKPLFDEMEGIPHHLINITSITDPYNVSRFQKDARRCIDEIIERGHVPIVVGGTGLYINALIYDYRFENEVLETIEDTRDTDEIYAELQELDPESAKNIHPNNRQRIVRSLQMVKANKKTRTEVHENAKDTLLYDASVYFLQGDRERLYERMNKRVDTMFDLGLFEEVVGLVEGNDSFFDYQAAQAIGYREFRGYFENKETLDEVKESIKTNTRRFAKRQITWFKHQTPNKPLDIFENDLSEILNEIEKGHH